MVEPSVEGQSPSVLHHHGLRVPPPPAAEQIQGGQGLDGGHAATTSAEAVTETLYENRYSHCHTNLYSKRFPEDKLYSLSSGTGT